MTRAPSHYEILGISPSATPEQVRAAYVRLMKLHHPDVLVSGAFGARPPDVAPLLNRCYAVLRDPQSRAWYDATLAGRREHPAPAPSTTRALVAYKGGSGHRYRPWLVAAAVLGMFALGQLAAIEQPGQWLEQAGTGDPGMATAGTIAPAPATHGEILRTAQRAMAASPGEAVVTSANCFAALRAKRTRRAEDLCVVFDNAYIYWHRTARADRPLPTYFDETGMRIRHLNALASSGADPRTRMQALRDDTFRILLAQVTPRATPNDPATAAPPLTRPVRPNPETGQSKSDLPIPI